MAVYEIPLSSTNQRFTTQLNSINYQFTVIWRNAETGCWFLDIGLPNGTPVVRGIPLVLGENLIAQYQHKIKGLLAITSEDGNDPSFNGLGITTKLYWVPPQ